METNGDAKQGQRTVGDWGRLQRPWRPMEIATKKRQKRVGDWGKQ